MASKEDIQEAAQALFCAMADYLGQDKINKPKSFFDTKEYKTYSEFKTAWNQSFSKRRNSVEDIFKNHVKSGQASFEQVDKFLTDKKDWYLSSSNIAKKLVAEVNGLQKLHNKIKGFGWSDVFYEHKDEIMNNIEKLFTVANEKQRANKDSKSKKYFIPFGELNKWSPADIYFASPLAKRTILTASSPKNLPSTTFMSLNKMISDLIDEGELLPLSLKFQPNEVTIKKVNFNKTKEWKDIEKIGGGNYFWTKYPETETTGKLPARDLKIFLKNTNSENDRILIRHDPSTAGIKGEILIKGMSARGGSLGFEQILGIIGLIKKDLPLKIESEFQSGNRTFKDKKKPIRKQFEEAVKDAGYNIKMASKDEETKGEVKKIRKEQQYDEKVGRLSAVYVSNVVWPLIINNILLDEKLKDDFTRMAYAYAASQSKDSAKFVIAK
jgi:hypothetical protein